MMIDYYVNQLKFMMMIIIILINDDNDDRGFW